ncbi:hypothetical protein GGR52DRAFT_392448 [Hypoxylon sp. FL1284]|nr:hypothetical protein GGR52DRAFT_392448 [Hypoxylon sp. FL1284]
MNLLQAHPLLRAPLSQQTRPLLLALAATTAVAAPLLAYARRCYLEWLALGPGGVPYHAGGWLAQALLHVVARRDRRVPVPPPYADAAELVPAYGPAIARSYLVGGAARGRRRGARPAVPGFVAPQRQTSGGAGADRIQKQKAFLAALAAANPALFEMRASGLEGPAHEAVYLRAFPDGKEEKGEALRRRLGRGSRGEFAHVHGEGSMHVTVSAADAALLIAGGWAERHGLSGVGGARRALVPVGYVFVYAPREADEDGEDEFGFWQEIVLAGARYVADGAGVEVVVPK